MVDVRQVQLYPSIFEEELNDLKRLEYMHPSISIFIVDPVAPERDGNFWSMGLGLGKTNQGRR